LIEQMRSRGAPFAVSCVLHVGVIAGLILIQHWVSSAVALHPPVLPIQLVTLDAPAPTPPAATPPRAPVKPPRLLAPPKPKETPISRAEERPAPPPAPIASATTPTPSPPAPAPSTVASEPPAADSGPSPATILSSALSSAGGRPSASTGPSPSGVDAPAPPASATLRAPAVAPEGITQYARPQGGYQVRPSYPVAPRRLGVQGTTLLRVHVLADGRIGDVLVERSAGHPDLDDAATDAVKRWRFDPARRGSEAVAMWVLLPVEFKLR
jgi:protein TonB